MHCTKLFVCTLANAYSNGKTKGEFESIVNEAIQSLGSEARTKYVKKTNGVFHVLFVSTKEYGIKTETKSIHYNGLHDHIACEHSHVLLLLSVNACVDIATWLIF